MRLFRSTARMVVPPDAINPAMCVDDETLARFIEGLLPQAEADAVRLHLDQCDGCRSLLAQIEPSGILAPSHAEAAVAPDVSRIDEDIARAEVRPGAIVAGKYEIQKRLGLGGMGVVYAARHLELDQVMALKTLHVQAAADATTTKRFLREGRAAAQLRSDHAVRIYDVGKLESGRPYMVMEMLEGEDLGARSRGKRLGVAEVVYEIRQACEALSEAHAKGLVHRDLKPQNLFLANTASGSKRVKVLDFGLAKELTSSPVEDGSALTSQGSILGSPHFMSPEQIRTPHEVDARTDVWALGATAFQLLTGLPPFDAPNLHGILARILTDPPTSLRAIRPDVPVHVEAAIIRALCKDREARFQTVGDFAAALAGDKVRAAPPPQPARRSSWWVAATILAVACALAAFFWWRTQDVKPVLDLQADLPVEDSAAPLASAPALPASVPAVIPDPPTSAELDAQPASSSATPPPKKKPAHHRSPIAKPEDDPNYVWGEKKKVPATSH